MRRAIASDEKPGFVSSSGVSNATKTWFLVSLFLFCTAHVHADELPPSAFVEGVVGHPQEHNLSCESRSATDLAAFWGVTFTEDDFFRRLPKSDNPQRGFLGDVDLPPGSMPPVGYGVYAGPIAANLRSFGLDAQARRNAPETGGGEQQ